MGCFQVGYTISTASEPMSKGLLIDEHANRIVAEDEDVYKRQRRTGVPC